MIKYDKCTNGRGDTFDIVTDTEKNKLIEKGLCTARCGNKVTNRGWLTCRDCIYRGLSELFDSVYKNYKEDYHENN